MNPYPISHLFKTLFPIGLLLIGVPQLSAANGTWTNGTTTGLWSTGGNWSGGAVASGTDSTATFGLDSASAQTIHLDTARTLGNLSLTNANATPGSWLLDNNGNAANILTLDVTSGSPTITVGANYSTTSTNGATISAVIAGNDGLTKAGVGRLILSGSNTYSGTTTISGGWLVAAHSNALGSGGITVSSSASNNSTTISQALAFQGGITIANAITTSGANETYLNNLSGDNVLTGGITTSTNTRINAEAGTSLTIRTGVIVNNRSSTGYFTPQGNGLVTIESNITGDSGVSRGGAGTGTLFLKGDKTYTGWTNPNGGILRIDKIANGGVASSIGASSNSADNLRFSEGSTPQASTLQYIGASASTDRSFSIGGTQNLTNALAIWDITVATTRLTVTGGASSYGSSGLSNANGSFEKKGAGSLVLAGTNRYLGTTTVTAGTLQFGKQVSLYNNTGTSWTAANIRVASGATLSFNVGGTGEFTTGNITTLLTNLAASSSTTNGMNTGSFLGFDTSNASGTFTINDVIANTTGASGGARGLVKLGTGTLGLTGVSTYTGGTQLLGGTLSVSQNSNLGNASGTLTFDSGTLLSTLDITMNRATTLNTGGGTFEVASTKALTQQGAISGAGALTKTGAGTLTLSNTNAYLGGTVLSGGTISVSLDANLGNAAGTLTFGGGTLSSTDTFTMNRATTLNAGGGTFEVASTKALTQQGAISGAGALTKTGAGTLTLSNTNAYLGGTVLSGGTISVSLDANLGNAAGTLTFGGGTLSSTDTFTMNRATTLNAGGGTFEVASTKAVTQQGVISGAGALSKSGAGTLTFSGANTYFGSTLVTGGTLVISGTGSIASSAATVSSGATLNVNGTAGTVAVNANGTLTGTGTLDATTIAGHHSPGNSPGIQNFASTLDYTNGSSVTWELIGNTETDRGTSFDGINVGTGLTITGTSTIDLVFNLGGSTVLWADSFWDTDRSWLFYDVDGSLSGAFVLGNISADYLNNSLGADRGSFSIGYNGSNVSILYSAVPEPSSVLLLTVGLMTAVLLRRRARS